MEDNRTANRDYLLPNPLNKMRSEDVPRLIAALAAIDADVAALFVALVGKAASVHTHEMSEILGLVSALAGKSPLIHNHSIGSLTGVDFSGAANGQFVKYNGNIFIPASIQAADIANGTTIGRGLLTAANAAAARDLIILDGGSRSPSWPPLLWPPWRTCERRTRTSC